MVSLLKCYYYFRYECVCVEGTSGQNCEINFNECESSPCKNGQCNDGVSNHVNFVCEKKAKIFINF